MDITLPITLTIAAACAIINVWLGARVSQLRFRHKVSMGDEGNERIVARMRAHANFVEYAPFFLILLGLVELALGSEGWLWAVAILFVAARLLHPFGMDRPAPNALRIAGASLTWILLLLLAGVAIATAYAEQSRPKVTYAAAA